MFTFTVQYRYPYLNQVVSGPKWLSPHCAEKPQNGPAGEIFSRGGRFLAETGACPHTPPPFPMRRILSPQKVTTNRATIAHHSHPGQGAKVTRRPWGQPGANSWGALPPRVNARSQNSAHRPKMFSGSMSVCVNNHGHFFGGCCFFYGRVSSGGPTQGK